MEQQRAVTAAAPEGSGASVASDGGLAATQAVATAAAAAAAAAPMPMATDVAVMKAGVGSGEGAEGGFPSGFNPDVDPELVLALRMSMEQQGADTAPATAPEGSGASATSDGGPAAIPADATAAPAVAAASLSTDGTTRMPMATDATVMKAGVGGGEAGEKGIQFGFNPDDDPELVLALRMSMEAQKADTADAAAPEGSGASAAAAAADSPAERPRRRDARVFAPCRRAEVVSGSLCLRAAAGRSVWCTASLFPAAGATPMSMATDAAVMMAGIRGGKGGAEGIQFGFNPDDEPELALALRMSMEQQVADTAQLPAALLTGASTNKATG